MVSDPSEPGFSTETANRRVSGDMSGPLSDKPDGTTANVQVAIIAVALLLICYDPHLHITSLDGHSSILFY